MLFGCRQLCCRAWYSVFSHRAFCPLSESYIHLGSGCWTDLTRPVQTLLAHAIKLHWPIEQPQQQGATWLHPWHNGVVTPLIFRMNSFCNMWPCCLPVTPLLHWLHVGMNANVLLLSVRKRKLEMNVIINCEPHNGVHVERAWLRIKNHSAQWAKLLSQSLSRGGGTLYCNVQHDRLGNKSHINKNHIVWKKGEEAGEGGRYFDLERRGEGRGGGTVQFSV